MQININDIHYVSIDQAYNELKQLDQNTSISQWFIRELASNGKIKVIKSGKKYLINFSSLIKYLLGDDKDETKGELQ